MEIYQTHHECMLQAAASTGGNPKTIAQEILAGEESRGKYPQDRKSFMRAIEQGVKRIREGQKLKVLGTDFPNVSLETDPICAACGLCPISFSADYVIDLYSRING